VIIGDGISSVDLPDYTRYRRREGFRARDRAGLDAYWNKLETHRLVTGNVLPHINYLCVNRLLERKMARHLITTNYDCYIQSILRRRWNQSDWSLNPCVRERGEPATWHGERYYNFRPDRLSISLWKIHGDLEYARMSCDHVFRLPQFIVSRFDTESRHIRVLTGSGIDSLHNALHPEGLNFADRSLLDDHVVDGYEHHTDYGVARDILFQRERQAAIREIRKTKTAVLVIGLSMRPKNREDLVDALVEASRRQVPIIFVMPTLNRPLEDGDSALLQRLHADGLDCILINEVSQDGELHESLVMLLERLGEHDLWGEYKEWVRSHDWWLGDLDEQALLSEDNGGVSGRAMPTGRVVERC
jgi:hypothetical protein